MSTAMTYLNPVRHYLNLTVRGEVCDGPGSLDSFRGGIS
jgi:hypothetical protein